MRGNFNFVSEILFNVKQFLRKLLYGRAYRADKKAYIKANKRKSFEYHKKFERPFYIDRYQEAGALGAYFWQDLWAARHLYQDMPKEHYDIGSRIDGFIGHISCFLEKIT